MSVTVTVAVAVAVAVAVDSRPARCGRQGDPEQPPGLELPLNLALPLSLPLKLSLQLTPRRPAGMVTSGSFLAAGIVAGPFRVKGAHPPDLP